MSDAHKEIIAFCILALAVIATAVLCYNQDMQNRSIEQVVECRVKQEFRERYRNLPRVQIEKVYTLVATGDEIVVEEVDK